MTRPFDYAKEAEECLEAAEKARSGDQKAFLLAMARVWANLAGAGGIGSDPVRDTETPVKSAGAAADEREHRTL